MAKHLWAICSHQKSLWIKWSYLYTIKNQCLWSMNIPSSWSWTWRKLLQLRPKVRSLVRYIIGDRSSTYLWHDNWHHAGPLLDYFGHHFQLVFGIPMGAKVSCLIYR
ncbi:hypothetical protein RHGRI_004212 [Rhododendron griersonianum]|uniref:Reverse transcriptase zinc-binding domain-containing protein n=1 Tax=Rhododendron griersonianum TaxID=479676 RepID=A0AAV6L8U8_9ERIC|nr:hypothetical protein RHGRI_004212 [Rhododendron griersonianum]